MMMMMMMMMVRPLALLLLLGVTSALIQSTRPSRRFSSSIAVSYLDSLQNAPPIQQSTTPQQVASVPVSTNQQGDPPSFLDTIIHFPLSSYSFDKMSSKGPRATFDWGAPQDWTRKQSDDGIFRAGSWYCTEGGWPSPNGKAVTEVFYVLEGHGSLGDSDGVTHYFGPGDMVIIPKGHTGRWDVQTPIHKVWAVNDHPNVEERGTPIRVQVDHYHQFLQKRQMIDTSAGMDPLYGNTHPVQSASNIFYDVGPTQVGSWTCKKGSFPVLRGTRQWFHLLEGLMFITDGATGTSKRCVAGDTVVLPEGWSGDIDVIEPVSKVWCSAE